MMLPPSVPAPTASLSLPLSLSTSAEAPTATLKLLRPVALKSLNASATSPMAVFAEVVVLKKSADSPKALLPDPSVLPKSAKAPTALLKKAVAGEVPAESLKNSALEPTAVLPPPSWLLKSAQYPTAVLSSAVAGAVEVKSLKINASVPTAVFLLAMMLSNIAPVPAAVLEFPLLRSSAPAPTAVLKLPSVRLNPSEYHPSPVLNWPVVRRLRALNPSLVLPPPRSPSAACIFGKNAKQASTDRIAPNIMFRFFMRLIFLSLLWPSLISLGGLISGRSCYILVLLALAKTCPKPLCQKCRCGVKKKNFNSPWCQAHKAALIHSFTVCDRARNYSLEATAE